MRECYHLMAPFAGRPFGPFGPVSLAQMQEKMNPLVRSDGHATRLHVVTTVLAARRYFLDGASKSEIAQELGISRFKVARLLDDARRDGIVRIEIGAPPEIDVELSTELAARYGLRDALVDRTMDGPDAFKSAQLGRAGAELLTETLEVDFFLGLAWGELLPSMVGYLSS